VANLLQTSLQFLRDIFILWVSRFPLPQLRVPSSGLLSVSEVSPVVSFPASCLKSL